ncbi:hypothetical protein L228DRAFT_213206 [Xylona heveae TC161]|uniref:GYF domain-containing protein n=1 Tax=Xylona heveae (strain CBS 132557 / TC161) TaxID=1328760 RepID=A0A165AIV4_XYLHT|nr:hypothetical protein L228DRAFT_213206 [Xylona heveae TC161]KZF20555.1 hypothetical protein L228DRAFT_213206 [Xylona heveae TC161]
MSGRRPAPRPKRAGEEFARLHHAEEGQSSKKPRFDMRNPSTLAPDAREEDAILDLDEIGKRGQQAKRNAVNLEGYESDSSNEGFDARADAKANAAKNPERSEMEDENDMFADLEDDFRDGDEDEDLNREGKKKNKDVRFLDETEIEGQVAGSKAGGHVSADFSMNGKGKEQEDESDSESDEEERDRVGNDEDDVEIGAGGKKEHAPRLDAFHMKSELEEGRFDADGNYVRKAIDPDAVHDTWLEGVSKKEMKKAKDAEEKREQERRQKNLADDQVLTSELLATLISRLEKGENTIEALARIGKGVHKKPKWQTKKKNAKKAEDAMHVDTEAAEDPAETQRKQTVETITGAADQLLTRGQTEIYDTERELLMRQYKRETGEDWIDQPKDTEQNGAEPSNVVKQWEYRWSDARDGGEVHGPYDGPTMQAWNGAGYFGEGVEFRMAGDTGGQWSRLVEFV